MMLKKFLKDKYHDYKYDATVKALAQQVLDKKISKEEALKKADERIEELPKAVEIIGETETDFKKDTSKGKLVIVYFFEESCPYYKEVTPVANELASLVSESGCSENAKVYKVDAKKNKALVEKYKDKIKSYPTLLMLYETGDFFNFYIDSRAGKYIVDINYMRGVIRGRLTKYTK